MKEHNEQVFDVHYKSIYVNRNEVNNAFYLWKYLNISLNSNKTIFVRHTKCLLILTLTLQSSNGMISLSSAEVQAFVISIRCAKCTVQVRDKRPTHTQNARTIFAQTRVKKRVLKYAFACIWCVYLLLLFTLITVLCVALFCTTKETRKKSYKCR